MSCQAVGAEVMVGVDRAGGSHNAVAYSSRQALLEADGARPGAIGVSIALVAREGLDHFFTGLHLQLAERQCEQRARIHERWFPAEQRVCVRHPERLSATHMSAIFAVAT